MYDFLGESPQSWEDLLYDAFDTGIPGKAEWHDLPSICRILNTIAPSAHIACREAAADARLQWQEAIATIDSITLRFTTATYVVQPQKLSFHCPDNCCDQAYFRLEFTPESSETEIVFRKNTSRPSPHSS